MERVRFGALYVTTGGRVNVCDANLLHWRAIRNDARELRELDVETG